MSTIRLTAAGGPPEVQRFTATEPPQGYWRRDPDHFPFPLTPLFADFEHGQHLPRGQSAAREEFAILSGQGGGWVIIDGYAYSGRFHEPEPPSDSRVAEYEQKIQDRHEEWVLDNWFQLQRPALVDRFEDLRARDLQELENTGLLMHIRELDMAMVESHTAHFTNGQARSLSMGRFRLFCQEMLGLAERDVYQLLAGSSPASSGPVTLMEDLAAVALKDPKIVAALDRPEPWPLTGIQSLLQPFLAAYGTRTPMFEYVFPTLEEQPQRVVGLLKEAMVRLSSGHHSAAAYTRQERDREVATLMRLLPDQETSRAFEDLFKKTQVGYSVRDDDDGISMAFQGLMRYVLLEVGRRFVKQNLLKHAERVLYLRRSELEDTLSSHAPVVLLQEIEERWMDHQRQELVVPPASFGDPFPTPPLPPLSDLAKSATEARGHSAAPRRPSHVQIAADEITQPEETNMLRGQGACTGIYTGIARVISREDEFDRVQPGDVLICPTTSPSWNILFGKIGALVTDTGGILSHAAIIAREFSIPAVVATRNGTKVVTDGLRVQVDGTTGLIRFLDAAQ